MVQKGVLSEIVCTRFVIGDFFETLGVEGALGCGIRADQTFEGAEPTALGIGSRGLATPSLGAASSGGPRHRRSGLGGPLLDSHRYSASTQCR